MGKLIKGSTLLAVLGGSMLSTPVFAADELSRCERLYREMRWECAYTSDGDTWACKKAEFSYWFWC